MRRKALAPLVVGVAWALLACGHPGEERPVTVTPVLLTAGDGASLEADLLGEGSVGLVLAHGMRYLGGKDSFREELEYFGSRGVRTLALSGLRTRHPEATSQELRRRLSDLLLGPDLAAQVYGPKEMQEALNAA